MSGREGAVEAAYGDNPHFVAGLDTREVPYVCTVESTFGVRLPEEVPAAMQEIPAYGGRGQPRKPRPAPLYWVKEFIDAQPEAAWRPVSKPGNQRHDAGAVPSLRVHWATGSSRHGAGHSRVHTGPEGWLLAERPAPIPKSLEPSTDGSVSPADTAEPKMAGEQEASEIKYWFSSLPPETSLVQLITLAHARWVIEQFYEDAKRNVAWTTSRDDAGMGCTGISPWSCWRIVSSRCAGCSCLYLLERLFPPSVTRSSLPHMHRQVLLWLFQDLVLWLIQSDRIKAFRPGRN